MLGLWVALNSLEEFPANSANGMDFTQTTDSDYNYITVINIAVRHTIRRDPEFHSPFREVSF